ncbi:MAG TPA: alpha-2-macroglobulin, partial [Alicycliphilus sp.]|nr:alpha-2-macroglobulin [Alicycliphilus sp.]
MTTTLGMRGAIAALVLLATGAAQALTVTSLTPQGEVAQVRQVVAKFDTPAVRLGDPQAPAPFTLACSDLEAARGQARWSGEREWVYQFAQDLPPGVRCTVSSKSGFKSASGAQLVSAKSYQFNTGGPFVQSIRPGTHQPIDEEQFFVLQLSGAATPASLQAHMWCVAEGVGERLPVRLVEGSQRSDLLRTLHLDKAAAKEPLRYATLACGRRLTAGGRVQLVYGQGVATPSGV